MLFAVLAVSGVAGVALEHFDELVFPGLPLIAAIYSSTRYGDPRTDRPAAGLTAFAAVAAAAQDYEDPVNLVGTVVFVGLVLGIPFGAGLAVRLRNERALAAEAGGEARAAAATEQEGARIARELHDVVGHALSVIAGDEPPLAPQPRIAVLPGLVEQVRATGLSVELLHEAGLVERHRA